MQSEIQNHPSDIPHYGLIGYPLAHSFSPAFFREKFLREGINASYDAFELEHIQDLSRLLLSTPGLRGLNVTTPHKQAILPYLDSLSREAEAIGAVNCIAIQAGKLAGHNTDWLGFRDSLKRLLQPHHTPALILGNGGAASAVRYALKTLNIPFRTVSRVAGSADYVYTELTPDTVALFPLIINTTVLGTSGVGIPPLPYGALTVRHLLFDLVYNPPLTPFMERGREHGAHIKNGLEMLELQAEASWHIWQQP